MIGDQALDPRRTSQEADRGSEEERRTVVRQQESWRRGCRGIRANCVAPGPVWTPLNPADQKAEKVAEFGAKVQMKRPAYLGLVPADQAPLNATSGGARQGWGWRSSTASTTASPSDAAPITP